MPEIFSVQENIFSLIYDFHLSKNVYDSRAIYEANTVAIFPWSEKDVYNIERPEKISHPSTDVL